MTKETFLQLSAADTLIIDVREKHEVSLSTRIKDAINIPMMELAERIESGALGRERMIVTVCQSGGRSIAIHTLLSSNGYNADYLEGGICSLG